MSDLRAYGTVVDGLREQSQHCKVRVSTAETWRTKKRMNIRLDLAVVYLFPMFPDQIKFWYFQIVFIMWKEEMGKGGIQITTRCNQGCISEKGEFHQTKNFDTVSSKSVTVNLYLNLRGGGNLCTNFASTNVYFHEIISLSQQLMSQISLTRNV